MLGVVDEANDVVPIFPGFVLFAKIDFTAVVNGRPVGVRDDFDIGILRRRPDPPAGFSTTANSLLSSRTRLPIGMMPTQVMNSFISVASKDFPAFAEHEAQDL